MEETLSDKAKIRFGRATGKTTITPTAHDRVYEEEDVREFIKRIDKETEKLFVEGKININSYTDGWNDAIIEIWSFIKECAGEDLTDGE